MNTERESVSAQHTPGPWRWRDELILAGGDPDTRHGKVVAESVGCFHWECEPDTEANARLIAAAPELLEAVNAGLLYCTALETARGRMNEKRLVEGQSLDQFFEDWIAKARAAIAKAKGQP